MSYAKSVRLPYRIRLLAFVFVVIATTAEIRVDQPLSHLAYCATQGLVSQFCLSHPAAEVASFEDAIHR